MAARLPRAIVDLEDFTESKNILVYGDTGSGKTGLIGRLPGKVLILAAENGTVVLKRMAKHFGWDSKDLQKRFKVWRIRTLADLEEAVEWLMANPDAFDWVAVDSLTKIQERAMRAAMEVAVKRNPERRDIDLPDKGEHQKMQNAVKRIVGDFCEMPVNVLFLAQAMNREDKDGNDIVLPFILGKDYEVSAFVCAQVHAYGYLKKKPLLDKKGKEKGTERVLMFDSFADSEDVYYWAKDRYMVMPKMSVIAQDNKQVTDFRDLLALIDDDADAADRANRAVETYDDPDEDDDDVDEDEESEDAADSPGAPSAAERREDLEAMDKEGLKAVLKADKITLAQVKGKSKDEVIDLILQTEGFETNEDEEPEDESDEDEDADEADEDDSDDDSDDDDDTDDDDDADDEDDTDDAEDEDEPDDRRAELLAMGKAALRAAVEAAGLTVMSLKGKSKEEVVDAVIAAETAPKTAPKAAPKKGAGKPRTGRFRPADED